MSILDNLGARLQLADLPTSTCHRGEDGPRPGPEMVDMAVEARVRAGSPEARAVRPRRDSGAEMPVLTGTCLLCGATQLLAADGGYPPATHCRRCFFEPDGGYVRLAVGAAHH